MNAQRRRDIASLAEKVEDTKSDYFRGNLNGEKLLERLDNIGVDLVNLKARIRRELYGT